MLSLMPFLDLPEIKGGAAPKEVKSQLDCNFFILHQNAIFVDIVGVLCPTVVGFGMN